jgi:divalent metal cation (Fe/Co/Zn/Cd) transporter
LWSGGKLIREAAAGLMDEGNEILGNSIRQILETETANRKLNFHQLRYRESGDITWIEFHLLFPKGIVIEDAHQTATEIETILKNSFNTTVNVATHLEPMELHDNSHIETH